MKGGKKTKKKKNGKSVHYIFVSTAWLYCSRKFEVLTFFFFCNCIKMSAAIISIPLYVSFDAKFL